MELLHLAGSAVVLVQACLLVGVAVCGFKSLYALYVFAVLSVFPCEAAINCKKNAIQIKFIYIIYILYI